jgi:hypothetical protein
LTNSLKGIFSSNPSNKCQVDKGGLQSFTIEKLAAGLQSRPGNEVAGLEGRTQLLIRLAGALDEKKDYFGSNGRPGNMVGTFVMLSAYMVYMLTRCKTTSYHILLLKLRPF